MENNYGPVSNLSILSKIIEKLVKQKANQFVKDNNIVFNKQFGFRLDTVHPMQYFASELWNINFRQL